MSDRFDRDATEIIDYVRRTDAADTGVLLLWVAAKLRVVNQDGIVAGTILAKRRLDEFASAQADGEAP